MSREARRGRTSPSSFWKFVSDGKNQRTIAFLGAGLTAIATASWTVITYVGSKGEATAVHSSVSANSITVQGNLFVGIPSEEMRKEIDRQVAEALKRMGPMRLAPNSAEVDSLGRKTPPWTDNGGEPRSERKALIQAIKAHGPQSSEAAAAMNTFAMSLVGRGNYEEASETLIQAINLQVVAGDNHEALGTLLGNWGAILISAGRFSEAKDTIEKAVQINSANVLNDETQRKVANANTAAALHNSLGTIYLAMGAPSEAGSNFFLAKKLLDEFGGANAAAAQQQVDTNLALLMKG